MLSKQINNILCVDNFYLDNVSLLDCMEVVAPVPAAFVFSSTFMDEAVLGLKSCELYQFWHPVAVQRDKTFSVVLI